MARDQDRYPLFAKKCISPGKYTCSLPSAETHHKSKDAGSDFFNTKYEFHYCYKRYRANIKDIKANEANIDKNKFNFQTLSREEKLKIRKQIIANQYLHTKNETFLNRIITMLYTLSYTPENLTNADRKIQMFQQFRKEAKEGIQISQLLLLQLFKNGTSYSLGDTCHLNGQRILANSYSLSQLKVEAMQIKGLPSNLTALEVERLKTIIMLCRGLLEENWTLLNENQNLYHQSSNVRLMEGPFGDAGNIAKRILKCSANLEANKNEFNFMCRISAQLMANQDLPPKKEEMEEERLVAESQSANPIVHEDAAERVNYPSPNSQTSLQIPPFSLATSPEAIFRIRGLGVSSSLQHSVTRTSRINYPLVCSSRISPSQSHSMDSYENGDVDTGSNIQAVESVNSNYDGICMELDEDNGFIDYYTHFPDAETFMNNILNQALQRDYQDLAVKEDPQPDKDFEMSDQ